MDVLARRYPQRNAFEFEVWRVQGTQPIFYKLVDGPKNHVYISFVIDKNSPEMVLLWRLFVKAIGSREYMERSLV